MPKSPEQFDFSKLEDQQKFEKLPATKQEKFIEGQMEEASKIEGKVKSGEASDYEEALELVEEEVKNEKWRGIYEKAEVGKSEKVPPKIEKLLGGDLFKEGSTSISNADEKEDVFAAILEKHESEEGHGIRYSVKTILERGGKTYDSGFDTVRGAFRDERDDFSSWWKEIKILEVKGDVVTIGKASGGLIIIEAINLKTGEANEEARIDLAKEREKAKEEKLKKQLEQSKNFEEVGENTKKLLEKDHGRVEIKALREDLKLLTGKDSSGDYDPVISNITFYLLKKGEETLGKFSKSPGVNTWDRPRFSTTGARFEFGDVRETEDAIIIPVDMKIVQNTMSGVNWYSSTLKQEKFELKFSKKKEAGAKPKNKK